MEKKYWQNFGELSESEASKKASADEFREDLPFELSGKLFKAPTQRRDFLKYLGFSTAAATLAASCETPVRKAIPVVNRPENIVAGTARYYASTYVQDGDALPVLVKVRDGRPIKIEGNPSHPYSATIPGKQGAATTYAQASVLDLYDPNRSRVVIDHNAEPPRATTD